MTKNPVEFVREVRAEVAKVTWPTRRETMITTSMVFIFVVIAALFVGSSRVDLQACKLEYSIVSPK